MAATRTLSVESVEKLLDYISERLDMSAFKSIMRTLYDSESDDKVEAIYKQYAREGAKEIIYRTLKTWWYSMDNPVEKIICVLYQYQYEEIAEYISKEQGIIVSIIKIWIAQLQVDILTCYKHHYLIFSRNSEAFASALLFD